MPLSRPSVFVVAVCCVVCLCVVRRCVVCYVCVVWCWLTVLGVCCCVSVVRVFVCLFVCLFVGSSVRCVIVCLSTACSVVTVCVCVCVYGRVLFVRCWLVLEWCVRIVCL